MDLHPTCTVLFGANAQGKSNFLEGIAYLSTLRSFRGVVARDLICWGKDRALLSALVEKDSITHEFCVEVSRRGRRITINGKGVQSPFHYLGSVIVVVFSPEDIRLPKASPKERRRFLDRAVFESEPEFLREALMYEKLLKHHNMLLKQRHEGRRVDEAMFDVFEARLAAAGARVIVRRRRLLSLLNQYLAETFESITRMPLNVSLRYITREEIAQAVEEVQIERTLRDLITKRRSMDEVRGFTGVGPHVDDIAFEMDGRPLRFTGSQGQMRACVLSLKIAEILAIREKRQDAPVLLLDDVSSELDEERNKWLAAFLDTIGCQTVVTTTDLRHVEGRRDALFLEVREGKVSVFQKTR